MPLTSIRTVIKITENWADLGGSPFDTNASMVAGLSVGSHCRAETRKLTVFPCFAGTDVKHTGVIVRSRVHSRVAGREDVAVDKTALFVSPGLS